MGGLIFAVCSNFTHNESNCHSFFILNKYFVTLA